MSEDLFLFRFNDCDVQRVQLFLLNVCGGRHHEAGGVGGLGEGDDVAQGFACSQNHGESVDAESDITMVAREVLNETEFQILIQHAVSERRFREIARDLGRLETTVRWQYHQALKKVRAACERRGITG